MRLHLGSTARRAVRYVGFVVLALVTFVFALQLTFPFDRVKDKLVEVLSTKYDVTIGDVERGILPGRVYFKAVTLRTRVDKPDEVPNTFYIESLEIDLGLLALLHGTASIDLDAKIGTGNITGNITLAKSSTSIHLSGKKLPSQSLPMREAVGLPMSGTMEFAFDLDLPSEKNKAGKVAPDWSKAEGSVDLACPSNCVFGDGKTKLMPKLSNQRNAAFASGGIEFGKVNIGSLFARVEIKNGKLDVTRFDVTSDDGILKVDFTMTLAPVFTDSLAAGCLRFRGSDALLKREPKTHAAISTTGAPLNPADNLFHIKLEGRLSEMRRLGQICGPSMNTNMDDMSGQPRRPNLTVQPDEPPRPIPPPTGQGFAPPVPNPATGSQAPSQYPPPPPPPSPPGTMPPPSALMNPAMTQPPPGARDAGVPDASGEVQRGEPEAPLGGAAAAPPNGSGMVGGTGAGEPVRRH